MKTRTEKDFLGEKEIPADAYYGIHAARAKENFQISDYSFDPLLIKCVAKIKKAAASVNMESGELSKEIGAAIVLAAEEMADDSENEITKKLMDSVIIDPMQGGAGTSINMTINEIIANRAIEILGGEKGNYSMVHPNDHVNMSQSTNDVIPSAIKLESCINCSMLQKEMKALFITLLDKATEFMDVIKVGRTQMQDAVPISLGQEFLAYADSVRRGITVLEKVEADLKVLNLGGTAIGTGINVNPYYGNHIVEKLSEISGLDLIQADNLIDATANAECFVSFSGGVKSVAISLSKMANDLRLMSSGPISGFAEINLPGMQAGSSIMPGKVNPVIPEIVNQVAHKVIGNDQAIAMAAEAGQLELNQFLPVIAICLADSLRLMIRAVETFREKCIKGITANEDVCKRTLEHSTATVTALCPTLGYEKSAAIAKKAIAEKKTIREAVLEEGLLTSEELDVILNPKNLVKTFNSIKIEK